MQQTKNDLPCIDCVCFAICKDTTPMRHSGTALMGHIEGVLCNKCSLVHNFIYNEGRESRKNILIVIDYFKKKMNQ